MVIVLVVVVSWWGAEHHSLLASWVMGLEETVCIFGGLHFFHFISTFAFGWWNGWRVGGIILLGRQR
jgi:hypothetical protein